jgi:hypothetical protein
MLIKTSDMTLSDYLHQQGFAIVCQCLSQEMVNLLIRRVIHLEFTSIELPTKSRVLEAGSFIRVLFLISPAIPDQIWNTEKRATNNAGQQEINRESNGNHRPHAHSSARAVGVGDKHAGWSVSATT